MAAVDPARRGKSDVAVDLAACVLAVCGAVRGDLAAQRPKVGHEAEQAGAAFADHAHQWTAMVMPAARDAVGLAPALGPDQRLREQLAHDYADDLAQSVSAAAAEGLAEAMDVQTARDIHPDVAWQRAVAGYGLAKKPMRGFITAALRTPAKDGIAKAAAPQAAVQAAAERALVAYADKIGECEVKAWATLPLPAEVAKAFDPSQRRDDDGRWTETGGGRARGGSLKVKERRDDGLDELLAGRPVQAPAQQNTYSQQGGYSQQNVYSQANTYGATQANTYGATENQYGAAANTYGADNDYGPRKLQRNTHRNVYVFAAVPPNKQPPPESSGSGGGGESTDFYLPMQNVSAYFSDNERIHPGGLINFGEVADYLTDVYPDGRKGDKPRYPSFEDYFADSEDPDAAFRDLDFERSDSAGRIELVEETTPWNVGGGLAFVDQEEWYDLLEMAIPLWNDVYNDPLRVVSQLDTLQIAEVFARAGYPAGTRKGMLEELEANARMKSEGYRRIQHPGGDSTYYDDGLTQALADYLVWLQPGMIDDDAGGALADFMDQVLDLSELDHKPIPEVFAFTSGLDDDDDLDNVRGTYEVVTHQYHSAIGEHKMSAPLGMIGLRETHVRPTTRRV